MSNITMNPHQGACLPPFLDQSTFPPTGGFINARLCMQVTELPGMPTCCLPCPATDWLYPDSFKTYNAVAEWLNVFGLCLLLFMLLSYAVLPVSKTRSHYLSICLIVSIIMICIGFIIPLGAQPEECYNEITPNDMHSSTTCAFSGAFILCGGLCCAVWICVRALSMTMQIVWDIIPGKRFLYFSQIVGWGLPAIFFALTMAFTGVSFRFGNACHVNHDNAMAVFWGPLLGIVAIAGMLQLWTFGYCMKVYLRSLWAADSSGNSTNRSNTGLPSHNGSIRGQTARAVLNRLKRVLFLQWRGLGIVTIILADVIFFSVVFVHVDRLASAALEDFSKTQPWLYCLVAHPTDKTVCLPLVNSWLINIETIEAVLLLLSLAGLQCFIMMTRPSIFGAWIELFKTKMANRHFVKLDAQHRGDMAIASKGGEIRLDRSHFNSAFEMQKTSVPPSMRSSHDTDRDVLMRLDTKIPFTSPIMSPAEAYRSPHTRENATLKEASWHERPGGTAPPTANISPVPAAAHVSGRSTAEHFESLQRLAGDGPVERQYRPPATSFSGIRPPSRQGSTRSGVFEQSRSGLGLSTQTEEAFDGRK